MIELKGDQETGLELISPPQLHCMIQLETTNAFFHIRLEPPSNQTLPAPHHMTSINTLNHKYSSLFQPLTTLPPSRPTNHTITLLRDSSSVNVQSYCYPYYQKQEIKSQVASMLKHGLIQPSTSLFPSSVLLVKKRDGS